jgi:predicted transcriptional regulator
MSRKKDNTTPEPTRSELEILQVLWDIGPATVRAVNDELLKQKEVNYATTLKFMQLMTEKGLLLRDDSKMKHVYRPAEKEEKMKGQLLHKFVDAMYKGSPGKLMIQLLGDSKTSKDELEEIRELLKKMKK